MKHSTLSHNCLADFHIASDNNMMSENEGRMSSIFREKRSLVIFTS